MNQIRFQNFEALHFIWLLFILGGFVLYATVQRRKLLSVLIDSGMLDRIKISVCNKRRYGKIAMFLAALAVLIFGTARPGWNPESKTIERRGRDVVFLLDVSRSMLAEDIAPSRLERAKLAIMDCVEKLQGDRVGLVVFAGNSTVTCPLTLDYSFFRMMLDDVSTQSISRGGTLIGDALRNILETVFDDQVKEYKDVILITDGEDHDSFPVQAAEKAGEQGVRLIAIGLGDENEGKRIPVTNEYGDKTFLTHKGKQIWTKLDADTLRKMVNVSREGRYLNVSTGAFDLGTIYSQLIATADKRELDAQTIERYQERFQIFLFVALILLLAEYALSERKPKPKEVA